LIEILVVVGILIILVLAAGAFQSGVWRENYRYQTALRADHEARQTLRRLVAELRSAQFGQNGAYPLQAASGNEIIFFSDFDHDDAVERLRYFAEGAPVGQLKRGVIEPSGSPSAYDPADEKLSIAVSELENPTAVFSYHAAGTSTPLAEPVSIPLARLVKARLETAGQIYGSQALIRVLKDNL